MSSVSTAAALALTNAFAPAETPRRSEGVKRRSWETRRPPDVRRKAKISRKMRKFNLMRGK
jgi:hypothetical protein